uniref:Uncharacterized protein n=1 Tax=Coccidioides posadasii RMSCC 3488 TaxID=454284 RepID=A0A0J6FJZ3_COCPO|nr:hypothetical protein CPAG_06944 [Coccidioides posadasii RMSCC 3488]
MAAFESTSSSLGRFLHLGHRYDEDDKTDMDCPGKRGNKSYIREDRRNGFRNGEEDPSFCGRKCEHNTPFDTWEAFKKEGRDRWFQGKGREGKKKSLDGVR